MANHAFQLVVRKGPRPGQIIPLSANVITVGRDPVSELPINDPEVSRHHARLTLGIEGYNLQDMASTNGSFVDGERLGGEPVALKPGQVIMFGSNVTLVYQAAPESDPMATVVAPVSYPEEPEEIPAVPEVIEEDALIADAMIDEPEEIAEEAALPEPDEIAAEVEISEPVEVFEADDEIDEVAILEPVEIIEEEEVVEEDVISEPVEVISQEEIDDLAFVSEPEAAVEDEIVESDSEPEPAVFFEPPDDDDEFATIIDEPYVAEEPVPAAEAEMPESFPTFDDVEPEPLPPVLEEPEPLPPVFEEPEPEQPARAEPEPVPFPVVEPESEPAFEFEATMPDFTPEQAMEPPPPPPVEPIEEPSGGRNRNLIIALVVILLLCCCCLIVSAVIYSTVESVQDTFQDLIDEATTSTMSTAIASFLR